MLFVKYFHAMVGFMHHFVILTIHLILLLSDVCESNFFLQVLGQLNMPCETLSLCHEKGCVEHARNAWNIVLASHNIGKP